MSDALVDALREDGAHPFDPVRFHYIEALAHRASAHQGSVRHILNGKLAAAVADYRARFEQARSAAQDTAATSETDASSKTLGDLVRYIAQHAPTAPSTELKSAHYFRNTWSRLSAETHVTQALGKAPKNAGPINSHMVALRSLALMRDISPDYLSRFMSYIDTLLCLDQGDKATLPVAKPPRATKTTRK